MAQKAEEYGSHNTTFEMPASGTVRVVSETSGITFFEHKVQQGDVWRMCMTKEGPIIDWVKLAVNRARASGAPAVFWLTEKRSHDRILTEMAKKYLKEHDTSGLEIKFMTPEDAINFSMERAKAGKDTISATGNVLRDYLTDLFPIIELGTSAKMLSIVPLLAGGGLYETGAGGSAPKHVEQFEKEGHLRWDSLGEFLAYAACLDDNAAKTGDAKLSALATSLDKANEQFLEANKNPSRKGKEIDNRGSHYYLALYWAQNLSKCCEASLQTSFAALAKELTDNEAVIMKELIQCQGPSVDLGG